MSPTLTNNKVKCQMSNVKNENQKSKSKIKDFKYKIQIPI